MSKTPSVLSPAAKKVCRFFHPVPLRPPGYQPDRNLVAQMLSCKVLCVLNGEIVLSAWGLELLSGEKQGTLQSRRTLGNHAAYRALYDMAERHKEGEV